MALLAVDCRELAAPILHCDPWPEQHVKDNQLSPSSRIEFEVTRVADTRGRHTNFLAFPVRQPTWVQGDEARGAAKPIQPDFVLIYPHISSSCRTSTFIFGHTRAVPLLILGCLIAAFAQQHAHFTFSTSNLPLRKFDIILIRQFCILR